METIRGYEQELSSTCAEITILTGRLRQAASQPEVLLLLFLLFSLVFASSCYSCISPQVVEMSDQLQTLFSDARENLEQMELEARGVEQVESCYCSYSYCSGPEGEDTAAAGQLRLGATAAGGAGDGGGCRRRLLRWSTARLRPATALTGWNCSPGEARSSRGGRTRSCWM